MRRKAWLGVLFLCPLVAIFCVGSVIAFIVTGNKLLVIAMVSVPETFFIGVLILLFLSHWREVTGKTSRA